MLNQPQPKPESTELLGDWHPLVQQLGSSEGLVSFSTASHSLQLNHVTDVPSLRQFLEAYQAYILIPYELPAIHAITKHMKASTGTPRYRSELSSVGCA